MSDKPKVTALAGHRKSENQKRQKSATTCSKSFLRDVQELGITDVVCIGFHIDRDAHQRDADSLEEIPPVLVWNGNHITALGLTAAASGILQDALRGTVENVLIGEVENDEDDEDD